MNARIDLDTPLWLVTDPTPNSELADILQSTTLGAIFDLRTGGLDLTRRPTLHTDEQAAADDAAARLVASRASVWIRKRQGLIGNERLRVQISDADGNVIDEQQL